MVDFLPAGAISHGVYGHPKKVATTAPAGNCNIWGVQKPGKMLSFAYESASIGAGFISCEGQRVCGATMSSDGLGRWAVPSAKDIPDVLNMLATNLQNALEYHDQTAERIYEKIAASLEKGRHTPDTDHRSKLSDLEARINNLEKGRMDRDPKAGQNVSAHVEKLDDVTQNLVTRIRNLELIVQNLQQNSSGGMLDGSQCIDDRVSTLAGVSKSGNTTPIGEPPKRIATDQSHLPFSQDHAHSAFHTPVGRQGRHFDSSAPSSGPFSIDSTVERSRYDYAPVTKQPPEPYRPAYFRELEEEEKVRSRRPSQDQRRLPSHDQRVSPSPARFADSQELPGLPGQFPYSTEFGSYRDRSNREVTTPIEESWCKTTPKSFDVPAPIFAASASPSRTPRKQKQEGCKQQ